MAATVREAGGCALDTASEAGFRDAVAPLFEGAPRFLVRLALERPFGSSAAMFERARAIARSMPEVEQLELIDAHPRLGASPDSVSASSFAEQRYGEATVRPHAEQARVAAEQARVAAEQARVAAELDRLNDAYEARFGFRYCVFVAGRPRAALLPSMEAALAADRAAEITRALDAVIDIAADRWEKRHGGGRRS
ncbi:MAG: 2-oxo-4-hydroxy-4-carboxy-5-ureidoimidazoline decarboxylase [Chloroflexi bacterium]|nr:2-oxo-4-hydroxy-4-carboxy-5-ureidoimidazoline decarboxylase [Chloroflexota bacterium]